MLASLCSPSVLSSLCAPLCVPPSMLSSLCARPSVLSPLRSHPLDSEDLEPRQVEQIRGSLMSSYTCKPNELEEI